MSLVWYVAPSCSVIFFPPNLHQFVLMTDSSERMQLLLVPNCFVVSSPHVGTDAVSKCSAMLRRAIILPADRHASLQSGQRGDEYAVRISRRKERQAHSLTRSAHSSTP